MYGFSSIKLELFYLINIEISKGFDFRNAVEIGLLSILVFSLFSEGSYE